MNTNIYTSIALVVIILVDATGDAMRDQGRQIWSHLLESIQLALWIAVWACFYFMPVWIPVYIAARIWIFDVVYNLCNGQELLYMGKWDLYGRAVRWFAGKVKQDYRHFSFIFKVMAFVAWIGLNIRFLR